MNLRYKALALAICLMMMAGCATLNESECRNADWFMIGIEDGTAGKLPSHVGQHRKACAKHDITPDLFAYRSGHAEGVKQYCTEARGFETGRNGHTYNGVCPPELEDGFLAGYGIGRKFYDLAEAIRKATSAIAADRDTIEELRDAVHTKEQRLVSDDASEAERTRLLQEIKKNQRKIGTLEANIIAAEKARAVKQARYQRLKRQYRY